MRPVSPIITMLAMAAAVLAAGCIPSTSTAGPMQTPNPFGTAGRFDVGETFSDGLPTLRIAGDEPITIEEVEPILTGDGLEYLGAYLAGDDRKYAAKDLVRSFPPDDPEIGPVKMAEGATVEPQAGPKHGDWELLTGYRVTKPGRWTRTAIRIRYSQAGRSYEMLMPATLAVCTSGTTAECEPEYADY